MTTIILSQEHNSVGLDDRGILVRFPTGERGTALRLDPLRLVFNWYQGTLSLMYICR